MAKKSSVQPTSEEGKSLFDSMMAYSEHPWHPLASGVWSQHVVEPTRERLIESEMMIGRQSKVLVGGRWETQVRYLTREEAEADVDLWLAKQQTRNVA